MRHARTVLMALLVAVCAFAIQAVEIPGRVVACMCGEPTQSLAEAVAGEPVTVVAGTVGFAQADRTPFVVDTWFHGESPSDTIWLSGGTGSMSSCDVSITPGERRLMVLWGGRHAPGWNGLYSTSLCSANAEIGTAEGDALVAEAVALFGQPNEPASPDPGAADQIDLSPWLGSGVTYAAIATLVALALFGAIALVARRQPQR